MFKLSAETNSTQYFEIFFLFFPENRNLLFFLGGGGGGGNINLSSPTELAQRVKKVKAH